MTEVPRSSFIPKEAPGMMPARVRRRHTFQVFDIIATAMLIGALLLAGGAYFMKFSAEKQKKEALEKISEQGQFNEEAIGEIRQFDRKLKAAEDLLKNHISPLKIFNALELRTKNRVQFTQFTFEHTPKFEAYLSVTGGTKEFKTLALQSMQFNSDPILQSLLVTTLQADAESAKSDEDNSHVVTFSMTGNIPQGKILYDPEFRGNTIGNVPPAPVSTTDSIPVTSIESVGEINDTAEVTEVDVNSQ